MSIDYGHLRRVVAEMEQGVAATTKYSWLELAQEVLRMQKELTDYRNLQHEVSINYAFFSRARREAAALTRDKIDRILNGETNE